MLITGIPYRKAFEFFERRECSRLARAALAPALCFGGAELNRIVSGKRIFGESEPAVFEFLDFRIREDRAVLAHVFAAHVTPAAFADTAGHFTFKGREDIIRENPSSMSGGMVNFSMMGGPHTMQTASAALGRSL